MLMCGTLQCTCVSLSGIQVANVVCQACLIPELYSPALQAEQKRRDKARKEATNQGKPLFDEDGTRRGILDKYDQSEEPEGMEIDAVGAARMRQSKQDEIRQKLAAGRLCSALLPLLLVLVIFLAIG